MLDIYEVCVLFKHYFKATRKVDQKNSMVSIFHNSKKKLYIATMHFNAMHIFYAVPKKKRENRLYGLFLFRTLNKYIFNSAMKHSHYHRVVRYHSHSNEI